MALRVWGTNRPYSYLLVFLFCAFGKAAQADIVYTFEDLPEAYFFSAGDQNIGNFYSGIDFGPNVTALSVSQFGGYDSSGFPPHSGDVVIWDATDATITISFASLLQSFGIWYTTYDPLTLQAFDDKGNLVDTVVGNPNTDGTTGSSDFLLLSDPGIESVALTSTAGLYVLDDMTIQPEAAAVPEPSCCFVVAASFLCILATIKQRKSF